MPQQDKYSVTIMEIATLAAVSTIPASPGGTECTEVKTDMVQQLAYTLSGSFTVAGTIVAHMRTSIIGGTDPAEWDTEDYTSFSLVASAAGRHQKTMGVDPDPRRHCVMVVNPGTEAVFDVQVDRVVQSYEAQGPNDSNA